MKNIFPLLRFVSVAILCLVLAACDETFTSAKLAGVTVSYWQAGKPLGDERPLSPEQVEKLSAWMQGHRRGWQPVMATYAPAIFLLVKHADGTASSANLMQEVLIFGQHQRSLSVAESQELHSIIGGQNGG